MDSLKIDDTTLILAVAFAAVYVFSKLLRPQSLVHPLLLGRQADVGRVRSPGESAVYRNYATGIMGRLPEKPKPEVRLLTDLVQDSFTAPRSLWSKSVTNAQLQERAAALGAGFIHVAGLIPHESTVLILLGDGLEFLITDLSLSSISVVSFTLTSLSLLIPTLEKYAPTAIIIPEPFLEHILEHVADLKQSAHHSIIVVGDDNGSSVLHAQQSGIRILRWEDLEASGKTRQAPNVPIPEPNAVFTISIFGDDNGELRATQLSHANVTAGVTASRLLFPLANPLTPSDCIFSVHSVHSAFGRAIAYTAIYEGCSFVSSPRPPQLEEEEAPPPPEETRLLRACENSAVSPTLLFMAPEHLNPLASSVLKIASSNILSGLAWRHKLWAMQEGYITNTSVWDTLIFQRARQAVLGNVGATLRGIVVSGGQLDAAAVEPARIAFSIPIVSAYTHPLVCGPVLASHALDLQTFPGDSEPRTSTAHVGPPATNVEAKLLGVLDESVEQGGDPTGNLVIRGPSVGRPLPTPDVQDPEGWVTTGDTARVQSNGTFKI